MITEAEAETILAQLEAVSHKWSRRTSADYLLTGILKTPLSSPWYGEASGKYYRAVEAGRSKSIAAAAVDKIVINQVARDLQSQPWVSAAVETTRRQLCATHEEEIGEASGQVADINRRISRFMDMAGELNSPGPVLRKIDELERQRSELTAKITGWEREDQEARALNRITDSEIRQMLGAMADQIQDYAREDLKDFLGSILQRVELDPAELTLQLHYRIPLTSRNSVASPRGGASPT